MNLKNISLVNEEKLLIALSRRELNLETRSLIEEILKTSSLDWDYLLNLSKIHGVTSFIYLNLSGHFQNLIHKTVLYRFKDSYIDNTKKALFLSSVLLDILYKLDEIGIKAISLKGPVLSQILYGDVTVRDFSDIDILVDKKDIIKTREFLISRDYVPQFDLINDQQDYYINSHYYYLNFFRTDHKVIVDLHWATSDSNYSFSRGMEYYSRKLENIDFFNKQISVLRKEDLLLLLCIHGCKHQWVELKWVCDIAELVESKDDMDFKYLIEESRALNCTKMFHFALQSANQIYDCVRDSYMNEILKYMKSYGHRKEQAYGMIFSRRNKKNNKFKGLFFFPKLMDNKKDRFLYFYNNYVCPTPIELSMISVGGRLFFVYYFLRVLRIIFRLITK